MLRPQRQPLKRKERGRLRPYLNHHHRQLRRTSPRRQIHHPQTSSSHQKTTAALRSGGCGPAGGSDYCFPRTSSLSARTNAKTQTWELRILGDTTDEPNEHIVYFVTSLTGTWEAANQLTISILDDDGGPSQPANLKAAPGRSQITLSWDDPLDNSISKYQARHSKTGAAWGEWTDISAPAVATTITSLDNGSPYRFQIRSVNPDGESPASRTITATAGIPAAPTGFSAKAGASNEAQLAWDNPNDSTIDYYEYQQKLGAANCGSWAEIPNSHSGTTDAEIAGLAASVPHAFKIRAVNSVGAGSPSPEVTATPPIPVIDLWATAGNAQATLNWDVSGDFPTAPTGVRKWLYSLRQPGGQWGPSTEICSDCLSTKSYTITGLANSETYGAQISLSPNALAFNANRSLTVTFTPSASDPVPPRNPRRPCRLHRRPRQRQRNPQLNTRHRRNHHPTAVPPQAGRTLLRNLDIILNSNERTTSYQIPDLTNGAEYTFQLRALNTAGYGAATAEKTATPNTPPPPLPRPLPRLTQE